MKNNASLMGKKLLKTVGDRQNFISLSRNYKPGDENCLPYPQMSPRGRALYKMCQLLQTHHNGIVISPGFTDPVLYLKRAQGNAIFAANKTELSACIAAQSGSDVFEYWRQGQSNAILDFPGEISFWINPKLSDLDQHAENILAGYVGKNVKNELLETLGQARLINAKQVANGFWLTR